MKVIQELIAYFDRRGKLTPGHIERLLKQGFLASEAPGNMVGLCDQAGQTYYFRVDGRTPAPFGGPTFTRETPPSPPPPYMPGPSGWEKRRSSRSRWSSRCRTTRAPSATASTPTSLALSTRLTGSIRYSLQGLYRLKR